MLSLEEKVNDFIYMNKAGEVLALCEKYYAKDVCMLNEGEVFARSMRESFDKQKKFVDEIKESRVTLVSKAIEGDVARLTFHYKMTNKKIRVLNLPVSIFNIGKMEKLLKKNIKRLNSLL